MTPQARAAVKKSFIDMIGQEHHQPGAVSCERPYLIAAAAVSGRSLLAITSKYWPR
jgi:hypothetical protein